MIFFVINTELRIEREIDFILYEVNKIWREYCECKAQIYY